MTGKHAPRPNSGHSTAPDLRFVLRLISRDGVPQACPRVPCGRCAAGLFERVLLGGVPFAGLRLCAVRSGYGCVGMLCVERRCRRNPRG